MQIVASSLAVNCIRIYARRMFLQLKRAHDAENKHIYHMIFASCCWVISFLCSFCTAKENFIDM